MQTQTPNSNDFNDLMESFKVFLKNTNQFTDYNYEGSGIKEIMRLLAYDAQQRAFQNNFLYNELLLDSASLKPNLLSIASNVGYTPLGRTASKLKCNITVRPNSTSPRASIVLSKDVRFYSSSAEGKLLNFSVDKEYQATLDVNNEYVFNDVTLLQGVWNRNSFLVQSQYNSESYTIPETKLDLSTLSVIVKPNQNSATYLPYTRFNTAHQLGMNESLYFIRMNKEGKYELEFGDNRVAKRLEYGNVITCEYLVTEGETGNNVDSITLATSINGYFDVSIANIDLLSTGGGNEESSSTIRLLAPLNFASSGNAVTDNDYIVITKKVYPDAEDVFVWGGEKNDPPQYGYVFVAVKPKASEFLSSVQKTDLVNALAPYNIGSITPIIKDPDYLYINLSSIVKYNPKNTILSPQSLTTKIQDFLGLYSKQKLERFGLDFDMSKLIEYINSIDQSIKGNKSFVTYEKHLVPELNFSGSYTIKFGHSIQKESVLIEGFTIQSIETDVYYQIQDDGTGVLSLVKYDLLGTGTILNPLQGSVDYSTGVIQLNNFRPVSIVDGRITIKCNPDGYDESITTLFNNIIKLKDINISLEVSSV